MRKTTAPKDRYVSTFWQRGQLLGEPRPQPVMHVFGPYTLSQARRVKKELLAERRPAPGLLEVAVCRPIDVDAMNAPNDQEE